MRRLVLYLDSHPDYKKSKNFLVRLQPSGRYIKSQYGPDLEYDLWKIIQPKYVLAVWLGEGIQLMRITLTYTLGGRGVTT